jgi:Na+/H+-dicarboxylate symporter
MLDDSENKTKNSSDKSPERVNSNHIKWILRGIMIAIVIGVLTGGLFPEIASKTSILGEIFLNALMMLVVPLVMLSMVVGITRLENISHLGSLGIKTLAYYLITTGISVAIGLFLVNIIKPGKGIVPGEVHPNMQYNLSNDNGRKVIVVDSISIRSSYGGNYQLVLTDQNVAGSIVAIDKNTVTVNFWEKLTDNDNVYFKSEDGRIIPFHWEANRLVASEPIILEQGKGIEIRLSKLNSLNNKERLGISATLRELLVGNPDKNQQGLIPRNIFMAMVNMDILPLIVFSILLGAALSVLGKKVILVVTFISNLNDTVMRLIHWVLIISPIGIFGLIASRIGTAGGFSEFIPELYSLGKYSLTVMVGLFIHGVIVLTLILRIWGKQNPLRFLKGVAAAIVNAFSTASSTATLPLTIQGVEEENKISNRTASFVLPLGATINMDGTALYEAVAAIFIAQVYGIELGSVQMVIIFLTATLAAIGAAGIPQAGLVTMLIVLKAVNLPIEGIGLLLTIDWLLDRFRTAINVWGDSVGAAVIEQLEKS